MSAAGSKCKVRDGPTRKVLRRQGMNFEEILASDTTIFRAHGTLNEFDRTTRSLPPPPVHFEVRSIEMKMPRMPH